MNEATILSAINDLRRIRAFESASEVEFLLHEMKRRPIVYCFTNEAAEAVLKSHDKDKEIERLRKQLEMSEQRFSALKEAYDKNRRRNIQLYGSKALGEEE